MFPLWEIIWRLSIVFSHNGNNVNVSFYTVDFKGISNWHWVQLKLATTD